jgi:hypothetical protein
LQGSQVSPPGGTRVQSESLVHEVSREDATSSQELEGALPLLLPLPLPELGSLPPEPGSPLVPVRVVATPPHAVAIPRKRQRGK